MQKLTQNYNLDVRANTIKLLAENAGVTLLDIGLGNDFGGMTPKTQATTTKRTQRSLKFQTVLRRIPSRKGKDNSRNRRQSSQIIHVMRDLCLDGVKASHNSLIKI